MSRADDRRARERPPRLSVVGMVLLSVASMVGLYRLAALAVEKVLAGRGLETYRTFWLVEFNYVAVLVLFAAVFVALAVSVFFWWREERLWRDLERKYGAGDGA